MHAIGVAFFARGGALEQKTFADRYQSVFDPVIFEPWAKELLWRASPETGEHILDLACGTGAVTRCISRAVKPGRQFRARIGTVFKQCAMFFGHMDCNSIP